MSPSAGLFHPDSETASDTIELHIQHYPTTEDYRYPLSATSATFVRGKRGIFHSATASRIRNIPPLAVGFLDLANSGDFAANVFNEVPVPTYAIVLMVIGGSAALIMSYFALKDAKDSLQNIRHLRQERRMLLAEDGVDRFDTHAQLDLNHRDLGTEVFDRAGLEISMGFAAVLVGIGTFMAIVGANHAVFEASNLLSGYIGNAPPALYGLVNTIWSIYVWLRAHKQAQAANTGLSHERIKRALLKRIKTVQMHAILTGITCLVSGAMSMLTPTRWWPYPILLVCGLAFIYGTWSYKTRIGYERALVFQITPVDTTFLIQELDFLGQVKAALKKDSATAIDQVGQDSASAPEMLHFLIRCDLFEQFCSTLLNETEMAEELCQNLDKPFTLDEQTLSAQQNVKNTLQILQVAQSCIQKSALSHVCCREKYLLEALGARLAMRHENTKYG